MAAGTRATFIFFRKCEAYRKQVKNRAKNGKKKSFFSILSAYLWGVKRNKNAMKRVLFPTVLLGLSLAAAATTNAICANLYVPEEAASQALPVSIGDVLCDDGTTVPAKQWAKSGKTAAGVVFYVDETKRHGWALALRDKGNQRWGEEGDIDGIPNSNENEALADYNGKGNTAAILATGGSYPSVQSIETSAGWYLPSAGQLRVLTQNLPKVNQTLKRLIRKDVPAMLFAKGAYWSSSETPDGRAWYVVDTGSLSNFFRTGYEKTQLYYVRAVIDF